MHPSNAHKNGYDMDLLIKSMPSLERYVYLGKSGRKTIDFSNHLAVVTLNTALLKHHYSIDYWTLPNGYLCPAVPGRADYIHTIADLVGTNRSIKCLDVGSGANCIYPIIGVHCYNWQFVGTDIDKKALSAAQKIIDHNPVLKKSVSLRYQSNSNYIFKGIFKVRESFDLTICNPPFHKSAADVLKGMARKNKNLGNSSKSEHSNFKRQSNELWTEGGEKLPETISSQHRQIVQAIADRDPDAAALYVTHHIDVCKKVTE